MIKYINSEGKEAPDILMIDGMQIINPKPEDYEKAGYFETEVEEDSGNRLELAKEEKIKEIMKYDSSSDVNGFYLNGIHGWFTPTERSNFSTSIRSAEILGEKTITLLIEGQTVDLPIDTAKILLAKVQRYADDCYIVTQKHIRKVQEMTGIAEIREFDITSEYPKNINVSV